MTQSAGRIYLSPPHTCGTELDFLRKVVEENWIAPHGPQVDAFEIEFARVVGVPHAVALSSGTAALHLALVAIGIGAGDKVLCSDLTFASSANVIAYVGAQPVFLDCRRVDWNLDPELLREELKANDSRHRPRALIAVDIYGQCADYSRIERICQDNGVILIEDAAEALGATYRKRQAGQFGRMAAFSFNGNKVITTGGGGMLVSQDGELVELVRTLSSQARDPAPYYEHTRIGFNYCLSNVLAAIGRAQLRLLRRRIAARRRNFEHYRQALGDLPGLEFMPEAPHCRSTRWLTCLTIEPKEFGATRDDVRLALEKENIESRPVWKPMHLQPVFRGCHFRGSGVSAEIFEKGLCLPSGSALTRNDLDRICDIIRRACPAAAH